MQHLGSCHFFEGSKLKPDHNWTHYGSMVDKSLMILYQIDLADVDVATSRCQVIAFHVQLFWTLMADLTTADPLLSSQGYICASNKRPLRGVSRQIQGGVEPKQLDFYPPQVGASSSSVAGSPGYHLYGHGLEAHQDG